MDLNGTIIQMGNWLPRPLSKMDFYTGWPKRGLMMAASLENSRWNMGLAPQKYGITTVLFGVKCRYCKGSLLGVKKRGMKMVFQFQTLFGLEERKYLARNILRHARAIQ